MSDARPITDVTDYVCGSCWSSFNTSGDSVTITGGRIRCPHCGHFQPKARKVTDAVKAAPATIIDEDDTAVTPAIADSGHDANATVQTPVVPEAPTQVKAHDIAMDETQELPITELPTESDNPIVTADDVAGSQVAVAGDEAGFAGLSEATDPEMSVDDLVAQLTVEAGLAPVGSTDDAGEAPAVTEAVLVAHNDEPAVEAAQPHSDEWKLKAPPGLTYNFHSLDALMGWVSSKDPADMEISRDGESWRPFAPFMDAARDGLSGDKAWAVAGGAPIKVRHGSMRSAIDDIARVDAIASAQREMQIAPSLSFGPEPTEEGPLGADSDEPQDSDLVEESLEPSDDAGVRPASGSVRRASGSDRRASGSVRRASGSDRRASGSVRRASGSDRRASGAVRSASGSVRRASGSTPSAAGDPRRTTGARPMPEKVTLEKSGKTSPAVIVIAVAVLAAIIAGVAFSMGLI
ncbi:MAG: hypothetical protein KC502_03780 [Myxococcales bacterium]|nr:hypothetical protein [Myxococcales bacterium]